MPYRMHFEKASKLSLCRTGEVIRTSYPAENRYERSASEYLFGEDNAVLYSMEEIC
mgnify:CR=1 FL=1